MLVGLGLALLHNSIPVLGVVYAPVTEDRGADCIAWTEGLPELLRNGLPVKVDLTDRHLTDVDRVMVSAAAVKKPELNSLCSWALRCDAQHRLSFSPSCRRRRYMRRVFVSGFSP